MKRRSEQETAPTLTLRESIAPTRYSHTLAGRKIGLLQLACLMYLVVSGGPYGLEDAIGIGGPGLVFILCIVVPLTLSLPTALMAAELTALIPQEGGFYVWVKEAFGPFGGFLEAYLTVLYTITDTAIYPVLFAAYLSFLIPAAATGQVILGAILIWSSGAMNLLGIRPVGNFSILLTMALAAPFVALVVAGFPGLMHWHVSPDVLGQRDFPVALGGALTVVIWNFCGWENLTVVAGEIADVRHNYLRAISIVLPAVALGYLLPLAVGVSAASGAEWHTGGFAIVGKEIGGEWLATAIGAGGAISAVAIFEAAMLWISRLPYVLAREGYLPEGIARTSKQATPVRSILICCVVFTLLIPLGFVTLVVIDVFFYMAALALELAAMVRLRKVCPERGDSFMIGGGRTGLWLVVAAPLVTWIATFSLAIRQNSARPEFAAAIILTATAWPLYRYLTVRYGGPQ